MVTKLKHNVFSEKSEDGIIKKVLNFLPHKDKWCVEFGAWDGIFSSNTRNLITKLGYSAVLIEGSKERFKDLSKNYSKNEKITTINGFVGFNKKDSLDKILKDTQIPLDFDFLSIDVDGNDYHIWKAISKYKPKVVCIEFNPTIPTEVRFIQPPDISINQGSSLLSLVELGKKKKYELISVLPYNAIFVKSKYFPLFKIKDNSPTTLRSDLSAISYFFTGYDGTVFLKGFKRLPWHDIEIKESSIQIFPKYVRTFPGNYSKVDLLIFAFFLLLYDTQTLIKKALRRINLS